jgi:hypothetical protein
MTLYLFDKLSPPARRSCAVGRVVLRVVYLVAIIVHAVIRLYTVNKTWE